MNKFLITIFSILLLIKCTDDDKIKVPEILDGVNLRVVVDPLHTGIFTDKITTDYLAFDMYSENKDLAEVLLFVTKGGERKLAKSFTQSDFNNGNGKVRVELKAGDFATIFNDPALADGSKVGNFTFNPQVKLNDGRVYPSFVKFVDTVTTSTGNMIAVLDSVLNLAPSINGAANSSFTLQFLSFITCPAVDISGNYLVEDATGTSTDGCCPQVTTVKGNIIKVTRLTNSSFTLSDFSGGLYFEWYDVYGIEKPEDSPGEISFSCNQVNFQRTTEPFGESVTGTGTYDPVAKTIIYDWLNGYGDKGTIKLVKQ